MKLSGYFSLTEQNSPEYQRILLQSGSCGAQPRIARIPTALNFDDTITPTLLFHFGVGLLYYDHPVYTPPSDFDAQAAKVAAPGFGGAPGGYNFTPFPANTYMPSFGGLIKRHCRRRTGAGHGLFRSVSGSLRLRRIRPEGHQTDREHQRHLGPRQSHLQGGRRHGAGGFPAAEQHSRLRRIPASAVSRPRIPLNTVWEESSFRLDSPYASFLLGQTNSVQTSAINDYAAGQPYLRALLSRIAGR